MDYSTIQQHEPLRVPSSFDKQGRALIGQLDEIFDDIYRRFGRLRVADLGENLRQLALVKDENGNYVSVSASIDGLRTEIIDDLGNYYTKEETSQQITTNISSALGDYYTKTETASEISSSITTALGDYSTTTQMGNAIAAAVADCYGVQSGISITAAGIEMSGGTYVKIMSGQNTAILLDEDGINMETAGVVFLHGADETGSSIVFGDSVEDAAFAVSNGGDVTANDISANSIDVNNFTIGGNPLPSIVVSASQPSGDNILWFQTTSATKRDWKITLTSNNNKFNSDKYHDYTINYNASSYLSGQTLKYGIYVKLYYFGTASRDVTLTARLRNGSEWITLGTATKHCYGEGYYVTIETRTSAKDNVMVNTGGSFLLRISTDCPNGQCRLSGSIVFHAYSTASSGATACSVYYID